MKVLLRESVPNLGIVGDVVDVAPGYARNYLLPRRIATEATPENVRSYAKKRERYHAEMAAQQADIERRVEAFGNLRLLTAEKCDEGGSLYGSVSVAKIVEMLATAGHPVDEKDVRLAEPIKKLGEHEVAIHVHGEHFASVTIMVEAS
ncbi:MAG: 50S ribosomal protein L9 [Planctomycetota bacterium]